MPHRGRSGHGQQCRDYRSRKSTWNGYPIIALQQSRSIAWLLSIRRGRRTRRYDCVFSTTGFFLLISTSAYGGFGFPSRMWGLATDNVISMDVVLANGSSVHASTDVNPDLFWVNYRRSISYFLDIYDI